MSDEIDEYILARRPHVYAIYQAVSDVPADKAFACIRQVERHLTSTNYAETAADAVAKSLGWHLKSFRDLIAAHGGLGGYKAHLAEVETRRAEAAKRRAEKKLERTP